VRSLQVVASAGLILVGATALRAQETFSPEERLAEMSLELPDPYEPFANYLRATRSGNLVFLGGHSECTEPYTTGKVGVDRTVQEGYAAARGTALCMLASLKAEIGDLDKVVRIVRLVGMVNAADDFTGHSQVINGASDLLVELFGDRGRHARAAVGVGSLPVDLTVEITMIVEVSDQD
jgi:enamine deaminase RidA (YjgF/YER057c/UK114 family)